MLWSGVREPMRFVFPTPLYILLLDLAPPFCVAPHGAKLPVWEGGTFCRRLTTRRPCIVSYRLDLADALDIIETFTVYFTFVTLSGTVYILIFTLFLLTGMLSFTTVFS